MNYVFISSLYVSLVYSFAIVQKEKTEASISEQRLTERGTSGGGLLGGVLKPLTGALEAIEIPTIQPTGAAEIPDKSHPYQDPPEDGVRGMCPMMNTLANHGYINRNGITTFAEAANACQTGFGLGYDTCVLLSAFGLLAGGDIATGKMSIGGADPRVPNTLGPALGLSHHGPFESDCSITRQDTYFGNQADFQLQRWTTWVEDANANGGSFSLHTMATERNRSYWASRTTNPTFDSLALATFVSLVQRAFIPATLLDGRTNLKAALSNVAPIYLNETFPPNWSRRATPYSMTDLLPDILTLYALAPTPPGKNQGVGNFVPLDLDLQNLSPAAAACLLRDAVVGAVPGQFTEKTSAALGLAVAFVSAVVEPLFGQFGCDVGEYTQSGPSAGADVPGVDAKKSKIVDGVYQRR